MIKLIIGVIVAVIAVLIIYVILNKSLRNLIKKILNKQIFKTRFFIKDVVLGIVIVTVILTFLNNLKKAEQHLKFKFKPVVNQAEVMEASKEKAKIARSNYKEIFENTTTDLQNCKNPYIPDGFEYVEGEWDTGFVIEDEDGNQFVWVPCTNQTNNENIPILAKCNFIVNPSITYFYCYEADDSYIEFLKSSLENGGFYISRFEIGNENDNPVSKMGATIWNNVSQEDAKEISENMYTSINSKLINGYAYDTAFNFIKSEIEDYEEYESTKISGTKSYKNIYDIVDSMFEYTSEMQYGNSIYRGIISTSKYVTVDALDCRRLTAETTYTSEQITFRTILYR